MREEWNYPVMSSIAKDLLALEERTRNNKNRMLEAITCLLKTNQTETTTEYQKAFEEKISCMDFYAKILQSEADTLEQCVQNMQKTDEEIAQEVRRIFSHYCG